jgi:methyltransferase (TIGR00027 family)
MALQEHSSGVARLDGQPAYRTGGEPSLTAMAVAYLRNVHATEHAAPVYRDTRSVQLVPEDALQRVRTLMDGFSREAVDALVLVLVVRHRIVAERVADANERGVRQLVILGTGLDTLAFALPAWGEAWRVFEVDHPATQEWKRARIASLGWTMPPNLIFAPCDFESQDLLSALAAAGFDQALPSVVTVLGVTDYLTRDATRATLRQLASLAPESEVTLSYNPPPDGTDPVVSELFDKLSPRVDAAGERFLGFYTESEIEQLVREAGFSTVVHYPIATLNAQYFDARPDALRLHWVQQILTAVV